MSDDSTSPNIPSTVPGQALQLSLQSLAREISSATLSAPDIAAMADAARAVAGVIADKQPDHDAPVTPLSNHLEFVFWQLELTHFCRTLARGKYFTSAELRVLLRHVKQVLGALETSIMIAETPKIEASDDGHDGQ